MTAMVLPIEGSDWPFAPTVAPKRESHRIRRSGPAVQHRRPVQAQARSLRDLPGSPRRDELRYRRTCLTSFLLAHRDIERVVDTLQRAIPVPQLQIIVHCTLWRQIFRQRLPLAARPQDVEDPIQHLAHVHRPFAPTMSRWRGHGLYDRPFGIGRVTGGKEAPS